MYKVRYKSKTYLVKAKDSDTALKQVQEAVDNEENIELNDDRLSPMTYKKLQEFGYGPDDWKDLTQEKANEIVKSHMQQNSTNNSKPSENTNKTNAQNTQDKPARRAKARIELPKTKDEKEKMLSSIRPQLIRGEIGNYTEEDRHMGERWLNNAYFRKQIQELVNQGKVDDIYGTGASLIIDNHKHNGKVYQIMNVDELYNLPMDFGSTVVDKYNNTKANDTVIIAGKGVKDKGTGKMTVDLNDPDNTITFINYTYGIGAYFAQQGLPHKVDDKPDREFIYEDAANYFKNRSQNTHDGEFSYRQRGVATRIWGRSQSSILGNLKKLSQTDSRHGKFDDNGFVFDDSANTGNVYKGYYLKNGGVVITSGKGSYNKDTDTSNIDTPTDTKVINNFNDVATYFAQQKYMPAVDPNDQWIRDHAQLYRDTFGINQKNV